MKLRNKKTGEIRELPDGFFCGDNLKKICEEWEDVPEEPKEYWYIEEDGDVIEMTYLEDDEFDQKRRQIGNYFESPEEAEKAVEKLKAWKRLKDKGFRFGHWVTERDKKCGKVEFKCDDIGLSFDKAPEFFNDITLIFGDEE